MKILGFLFFAAALVAFPFSARAQTDAEIQKILAERAGDLNPDIGISVAVDHGDARRFVGSSERAARSTVYEIGSVTKVFTTALLAEMVKRGEVKLDDPVARYLPETVKMPARGGKQITLLDLATHTSGLPRLPTNLKPANPLNPYADYAETQLYEFLSGYELPRAIGEKYEYSNLGMGLLGHALSRAAGKSYEDLVKERILLPLGMKNTRMTLSPEMQTRLAPGHNLLGKPVPNWDLSVLSGAGSFRSTAEDMALFVAANAGLKEASLNEIFVQTHTPKFPAGSPATQIGLGWHVSDRSGSSIVWHNGATGGYRSFIGFDRRRKKGVVVLANAQTDIDDIGFYLLGAGELLKSVAVAPEILDRYVGTYEVAPNFALTVTREGKTLFIQATDQAKLPVVAESETEFVQRQARARFKFGKNEAGETATLTLIQNGREIPARKIK